MINKSLTFFGSFVSALIWAKLFRTADVSSSQVTSSTENAAAFAVIIGGIFLVTDVLIVEKRAPTYYEMSMRTFLVSVSGSLVILLGLFFLSLGLGYLDPRDLFLELTAVLILGALLVVSNFFPVLVLKTVTFLLGINPAPRLR